MKQSCWHWKTDALLPGQGGVGPTDPCPVGEREKGCRVKGWRETPRVEAGRLEMPASLRDWWEGEPRERVASWSSVEGKWVSWRQGRVPRSEGWEEEEQEGLSSLYSGKELVSKVELRWSSVGCSST